MYGGAGIARQARLAARAHILVATPGRLLDLIERGTVSLERIQALVHLAQEVRDVALGSGHARAGVLDQPFGNRLREQPAVGRLEERLRCSEDRLEHDQREPAAQTKSEPGHEGKKKTYSLRRRSRTIPRRSILR